MSYVSTVSAAGLAGGDNFARRTAPAIRMGIPVADDRISLAGWLQIGLLVATLSSVSFVMSIVAAGAF